MHLKASTVAAAYSVTMPSSPPSVRPVLAALLTALVIASTVLVSAPPATASPAHTASGSLGAGSPAAPPQAPEDSPVSMDLVSLTPTSLAPDGTLEAQVDVTNTSSEPLSTLALELRTRTARVTDRDVLTAWQSDTTPSSTGAALASSSTHEELAPGESTVLTVQIAAEDLGYSEEPYYWGTRRLALTVTAEEQPLSTLRTFVVWRPADAEATITQSVLLPFAAEDPAAMVTDPEEFAASAESGRLAALRTLSQREDVDWWLDPALLDPPLLAVDPSDGEDPSAVREYTPEPLSAELAGVLDEAVGQRTVLAMPYAQADTRSLDAAGTDQLSTAVREQGHEVWTETGIVPRAAPLQIDPATASPDTLEEVLAAGGDTAIVPSSSLRTDPDSAVTPSSVGVYPSSRQEGEELTLLAPDPTLSSELSLLTEDSDAEQTRQRVLAETATIASEYTTAPRHLLIAPSAEAELDPEALDATLDALAEAPWIVTGRTSTLLDAADQGSWTTDPRSEDGELYALGRIGADDVLPSGPTENGRWEHLSSSEDAQLLDPEPLHELADSWEELDTLAAAMEDDSPLEAARREIIAGTSARWRGEPEIPAGRAEDAQALAAGLRERIKVVPASGYNVISDAVSVPITLSNELDTPITVRIEVTSDKPLVQVGGPQTVEVPARGRIDAAVDVEAIANGTVTLTTVVTTEDGRPLTTPVDVPLTVNPSWENWTTLVLVIAMGLLVIIGVARARRTGAATRAPAVRGPEDPEELARSGRSTLDTHAAQEIWSRRSEAGRDPGPDRDPHPDPTDTDTDTDTDLDPDPTEEDGAR